MDDKKGKRKISSINIDGRNINLKRLSSLQYFYQYKDFEKEECIVLDWIGKELVKDEGESFQLYLFATNPDWILDSKINRYKKYWNEVENHELLKRRLYLKNQTTFEDSGYIRHCVLCLSHAINIPFLLQYALGSKSSALFILKDELVDFKEMTEVIFNESINCPDNKLSSLLNWKNFINTIVSNSGVALIMQGGYDFGEVKLNVIRK
jgi:hypothetical protein